MAEYVTDIRKAKPVFVKESDAKAFLEMFWALGMPKTCKKATLHLEVNKAVEMECTFFLQSDDESNLSDIADGVVKRYQLVEKLSDAKQADGD